MLRLQRWGVEHYGDDWRMMGNEVDGMALLLFTDDSELDAAPVSKIESEAIGAACNRLVAQFWKPRPKKPHHGVSMIKHPLQYFAACDQCGNGMREETGTCRHCVHHGVNNAGKREFLTLDPDYTTQLISVITTLHSAEVREAVLDATGFILWDQGPSTRDETPLPNVYCLVQKQIDANAEADSGMSREKVAERAGWNEKDGAQLPKTCAQIRWHTVQISNSSVHAMDSILAAALIASKAYDRACPRHSQCRDA